MGTYIFPKLNNFLSNSGGTVSGNTVFSNSLTASTFYSGTTLLETIIRNIASQNTIPLGAYIWTSTTGSGSYVISGWNNSSLSVNSLVAAVDSSIDTDSDYSMILGGYTSNIDKFSRGSTILGGWDNQVKSMSRGVILGGAHNKLGIMYNDLYTHYQNDSSIIGGMYHKIYRGYHCSIIGGGSNIITGDTNTIDNGVYGSSILGGMFNRIDGAWLSTIVGGLNHHITHGGFNSAIIGGHDITASTPNMVYVPNLNINNLNNSTGITDNLLFTDSNGFVYKKTLSAGTGIAITHQASATTITFTGSSGGGGATINNGTNTFTGGTPTFQSVNITALTISNLFTSGLTTFVSAFTSSFSATTYFSGSTPLQTIINNSRTRISNGTNTYTGGTFGDYTINITGGTFYNLSSSGLTTFVSAFTSSFSATTYFSGSTPLQTIINNSIPFGANLWTIGNTSNSSIRQNFGSVSASGQYSFAFGRQNVITNDSSYNTVFGGYVNLITSTSVSGKNTIIGGKNNLLSGSSVSSGIFSGAFNRIGSSNYSGMFAGKNNTFSNSNNYCVILGGSGHIIGSNTTHSVVLGGINSRIDAGIASSIVLGSNLTGRSNNTVVVSRLEIQNIDTVAQIPNVYVDDSGVLYKSNSSSPTTSLDISGYKKRGTSLYDGWYNSQINCGDLSSMYVPNKNAYFVPIIISTACTISSLAVIHELAGMDRVDLAIYNSIDQLPYQLLYTGNYNSNIVGINKIESVNTPLTPGLYFLGICVNKEATIKAITTQYLPPILGYVENGPDFENVTMFIEPGASVFASEISSGDLTLSVGKTIPSIWINIR